MFQSNAAATLLDKCQHENLVIPDYEDYCFANVPGTGARILNEDIGQSLPSDVFQGVQTDVSHVVVIVLDSLGWYRWHRDASNHRLLERINTQGTVTPLTSVASSSTAPAIASVHTGVPPAEHGILGCDVYLPDYETIIRPFPHEIREDVAGDSTTPPVTASDVVEATPVYPALETSGVETHVVQPAGTLGTAYANAMFQRAQQVPYESPSSGAAKLRETIEGTRGQSYTYWYASDLDTVTHEHGPDSAEYHDTLSSLTQPLSRELYDRLDEETATETLLLITADHGAIPTRPQPSGCLDLREIDDVMSNLRRCETGQIPPFGDPRLCQLAVDPGSEESVVTAIQDHSATALTREKAVDLNIFGSPSDSKTLARRCGDVIVFAEDRKLVYPSMEKVVSFNGIHGGLTPREMLVPFAAAHLSKLQ